MLRTVQITWSYLYMKKKKAHKSEGENMALSLKCIWLFAQLRYFFLQIFSRKLQHRRRAGDGASRSQFNIYYTDTAQLIQLSVVTINFCTLVPYTYIKQSTYYSQQDNRKRRLFWISLPMLLRYHMHQQNPAQAQAGSAGERPYGTARYGIHTAQPSLHARVDSL